MSVGVFCRLKGVMETAFGNVAPAVRSNTDELRRAAEARNQPWDLQAYAKSQHDSVCSVLPGRPWYDATLQSKAPPVGFETVVWPPTFAALQQLLHGSVASIVAANTGESLSPWIFRVDACSVVKAVLNAEHVFETDTGQFAIVGLPFPDMDTAGAALLKTAVFSGGIVRFASQTTMSEMPPGHRRRNSVDSAEAKVWIGSSGHTLVKMPYESKWKSPRGLIWPNHSDFWTRAWPAVVEAKVRDVQSRREAAFGTGEKATKVSASRVHALIAELGLPESPSCVDRFGKPIGADRARKRQAEWKRYLGRRYDSKFVPRCPGLYCANTSRNALVQFCPQDEHHRCVRSAGSTVADVLAKGTRAECVARAISVGGNNERYQAAGVLSYVAGMREATSNGN